MERRHRRIGMLYGGGVALLLIFVLVDYTAAQTCVEPPSGLVSWWPGEGNANDVADDNDGILPPSGVTFETGMVEQAFRINGNVVEVPDAPSLDFGAAAPITVDAWVYRTASNPVMHFVGKRSGCVGGPNGSNYQLALNTISGEGLVFGAGSGNAAASGQDLPLNTWTHLAGTFDGSAWRLYINGSLAATANGTMGPTNDSPLKIGGSGSCTLFAGFIDEVEIFDRALSASEIQAIHNAGSAGKCKSSVVDTLVRFEPIRSTFQFTPNPPGCPAEFVGTFSFDAKLTNISTSSLSNLVVEVIELTGGNLLQNADGGSGGVGALLTVPELDEFTDGVLSPDEFVDVTFIICLQERERFIFMVDVLGVAAEP